MKTLLIFSVAALAICLQATADDENNALRAVADSSVRFANNFFKVVADGNSGNLITSPLSAHVVLAMAAYGANGTTATEMRSTLLIPSETAFGQTGYQSLIRTLNAAKGVELRLANKIYTAAWFTMKDAYKQLTTTKFMSASQEVDFSNPGAAAGIINAWCEQQTNHRIKNVITPDSIDSDTKLVLVNAVYFKGRWATKFDATQTLDRPFHVDARTTKNVPTMFIKHSFRFGHLSEVDARFIELPYESKEFSMIIILPNQVNGLKRIIDNIHQVNLTESLRQTYPSEVELFLPKFKFESTLDLKDSLEKLGMAGIFQNGADFSGIADTPLKVSKVVQKAYIEVNEEGSEAAAVTVMQVIPLSAAIPFPERLETFRVNRPYYYEIYHHNTKIPLFTGISHQPSLA